MSRDRISIEVDVKFPTINELQTELAKKWERVKSNFEGKINVGVDGNSLRSVKAQIKKALGEQSFDIKVDTSEAIKNLNKFENKMEDIQKLLSETYELKIDLNMEVLDKSFKEVLQNLGKVEESSKKQKNHIEEQNKALKEQSGIYDKIETKISNKGTSTKTTMSSSGGYSESVTEKENGDIILNYTENRVKALKEIESIYKSIYKLELSSMDASDDSIDIINREIDAEKQLLNVLEQQYNTEHKKSAGEEDSIKTLNRMNEMNKALKEQTMFEKELKKERSETEKAVSKVVQLENKLISIKKQLVDANEEESATLKKELEFYEQIQNEISQQYRLEQNMTQEQRNSLNQVKQIGDIEIEKVQSKKKQIEEEKRLSEIEKQTANEQKQALNQMLKTLKNVYDAKYEIARIEERANNGGELSNADRTRLELLKEQLSVLEQQQGEDIQIYRQQGLITSEMEKQLAEQKRIHETEQSRAVAIGKIQAEQDAVNKEFVELKNVTNEIGGLQRDLVFAGMREENVIEQQLVLLKAKQREIAESLQKEGALTDSMREELNMIERAQTEQAQLNRLRQDAREKDRAFNDVIGLVDPYEFYNNAQQFAQAVLEPVASLDEALVGIRKVAEGTEEQFRSLERTSYDMASSLGVTADEYLMGIETWVTAGKNLKESEELAKTSLIGSFVGSIAPDEMVKYMAVPLASWEKEGLKATDIINVMNETANKHAVEMGELGKGYMRASGVVKNAGISFADLTGLITGASEATRMSGERIGTSLKTISINYNNIKGQITNADSKKFDFLKSIGIDMSKTNSLLEVLEQLKQKQDDLTKEDMNQALYYLAGKEHQNILAGIVDQWDTVKVTIKEANEEMGKGNLGSAYQEHAKQADSVQFKLAKLKNTWNELLIALSGGSSGVGDVLDILTVGLESVSDLVSNETFMSAVKYIIGGLAWSAGVNASKRFFDVVKTGLGNMVTKIGTLKSAWETLAGLNSKNSISGLLGGTGKVSTPDMGGLSGGLRIKGGGSISSISSGISNVNKKISTTGTLLGKVGIVAKGFVGFIPLIGDALLLLDAVGVPVFDTFLGFFKKMTKSNEDLRAEMEQTTQKFLATNGIMNGEASKRNEGFYGKKNEETGEMEGGLKQNFKIDYESDGYLSSEEFTKLQDAFSELAESSSIDITLDRNDIPYILEQIDELERRLYLLTENDVKDLGKQYTTEMKAIEDANRKIAKEKEKNPISQYKKEIEKLKKESQAIVDQVEKQGGVPTDVQKGTFLANQGEIEALESKIKKSKKAILDLEKTIETSDRALDAYTEKLIDHISKGGDLSAMTAEEATNAITPMIDGYEKLRGGLATTSDSVNKLNDDYESLTEEQWRNLQERYKNNEVIQQLGYDEIQLSGKVGDANRERAREEVAKEREVEEARRKSMEEALIGLATQMGYADDLTISSDGLITIEGKLKDAIAEKNEEINNTPTERTYTANVAIGGERKAWENILETFGKKATTKNFTANVTIKEKKVGVAPTYTLPTVRKSVSVSDNTATMDKNVSDIVSAPTSVKSVDNAKSTTTTNDAVVNSDVWRYWNTDNKIEDIQDVISDLSRTIQNASDNQKELIKLYQQQNAQIKKEIALQNTHKSESQSEMNSVLSTLRGYGFKTSGNEVTNLSIAKNFKGDKAQDVEKALNDWKSLRTELISVNNTIASLNDTIKANNEAIEKAKIQEEIEKFEGTISKIESLLKKISNSNALTSMRLSLVDENDVELKMSENENGINSSISNIKSLNKEFNKLATSTVNYKENGEELQSQLESLSSEILSQADSIIQYRDAIDELEISRVANDFEKLNSAIELNNSQITNNISNLQDGLLSGTDLSDLQSSIMNDLDLRRNNQYERIAQERIDLEMEVQQALDAFARKNVEREANVSNAQLEIASNKYSEMLSMASDFANGKYTSYNGVSGALGNIDLSDIISIDNDYKLAGELKKIYDELDNSYDELTKQYEKNMNKAISPQEKDSLTNRYILDSLKLQEQSFNTLIEASRKAISELESQLKDESLSDDNRIAIQESVDEYEQIIIDAQNNIKDTIRERFDFEFALLDEANSKYTTYGEELIYLQEMLGSVSLDMSNAMNVLTDEMLNNEKQKNNELSKSIDSLREQQSIYEEGSFEWNIINEQLSEYLGLLKDSNRELIDMNNNVLSNSFSDTMKDLEKYMFDGKTVAQLERAEELWISGIEREIALEDTYQRLADLKTDMYNNQMDYLASQEKLSRFEMDYLNKQLDILELEQKLANLDKEKNIQVLQKQADGTWDWEYQADANAMSETEDELAQKRLELQEFEEQSRKDFVSSLDEILSMAQNGEFENIQDFKDAIDELSSAYKGILKDYPEMQDEYIKDLIEAYSHYINENQEIIDGILDISNSNLSNVVSTIGVDIANAFKDISDELGKALADAFMSSIPNSNNSNNVKKEELSNISKSISIHLDNISFPNVTSPDGIKDAIMNLPSMALQKSKEKL